MGNSSECKQIAVTRHYSTLTRKGKVETPRTYIILFEWFAIAGKVFVTYQVGWVRRREASIWGF